MTLANRIATVHRSMGEYAKAIKWAERALEIAEQYPDAWPGVRGFSYRCLGEAYLEMRN